MYGERVVTPAMDELNESGSNACRGLIPSGDSPFFPASGTDPKIQFAFFPRESWRIPLPPCSSPRQELLPLVQAAR